MQQFAQNDLVRAGVVNYDSRSDFQTKTGQQAPPYDPNLLGSGIGAIKRWVATGLDPANPNAPYTLPYLGLNAQGQPAVLSMTIPASMASKLNLAGSIGYQKYDDWLQARGGTKTVHIFSFNGQQIQRPVVEQEWPLLLTPQEAQNLAAEIGNGAKVVDTVTDQYFQLGFLWDPNDPRRIQDIVVGTWRGAAGYLFRDRSVAGVGAPGTWSLSTEISPAPGSPKFTPATPATGQAETRVIPIPIRDLATDEKPVFGGGLFPELMVQKGTDTSSGTGISSDLEAIIRDTHDRIVRIDNLLPK